jgi:hypothetical protein
MRSSSLKMAFETAEGAQPPLGFFDPLGLLKEADQGRFERLRFVELKHGKLSFDSFMYFLGVSCMTSFHSIN